MAAVSDGGLPGGGTGAVAKGQKEQAPRGLPGDFGWLVLVVGLVSAMWLVELLDLLPRTPFDSWGIRPRSLRGLLGIPVAPFLHSGFGHLIANTLPFLVLGAAIAIGGVRRFLLVTAIVLAVSGAGVWLFASPGTVHLGASGLVFGYLTYLLARGLFARNPMWILGGVVVLVIYGGVLWGLVPRIGVSWTGHVFGAAGGVLAAWLLHRRH
jgi:membrane associated rhomboid family serine protease